MNNTLRSRGAELPELVHDVTDRRSGECDVIVGRRPVLLRRRRRQRQIALLVRRRGVRRDRGGVAAVSGQGGRHADPASGHRGRRARGHRRHLRQRYVLCSRLVDLADVVTS